MGSVTSHKTIRAMQAIPVFHRVTSINCEGYHLKRGEDYEVRPGADSDGLVVIYYEPAPGARIVVGHCYHHPYYERSALTEDWSD